MRRVSLLVAKDLRILRRSPVLLGVLVAYPVVIALLIGLVAAFATAKPRVALVDREGLPARIEVGGRSFDLASTIDEVAREVELVRLSPAEARRQLEAGRVIATVTVPPGFIAELRAMVRSPRLQLETVQGGLAPRVSREIEALVYGLNRQLQEAYIQANLRYVELILDGGQGTFLGRRFDVLGLDGTREVLSELPRGPRLDRIREFVDTAELALGQTGTALRATANPIELERVSGRGRSWTVSAQVQAYALALTLSFLTLLLAAGAFAAERDENVLGRLARGLVGIGQIVWAKVALAAVVALAVGLTIALAFGLATELAGVPGGEPWSRLPLLAVGLALAGASLGALGTLLGALAGEARSASLVALLVVLPIVFCGLVPRGVVPVVSTASDAFPFAHAVRLFAAALYEASPWRTIAVEALWLAGLGLVFGVAARSGARRLVG